ncbi:MAG: type II secretion system F family protein [Terricaulis sp.]
MSARRFRYRAIDAAGATISDILTAETRADALRRLTGEKKTVLELAEIGAESPNTARASSEESVLMLRQLAVMTRAGVDLLEAIEIIASSLPQKPVADALRATALSLRQGDRLAKALEQNAPFYPPYVYALIRAGEASGRLPLVLEEAARQLAFEKRLARDIQNALTYPAFLVLSGLASVGFLFYVVVPRFAEMLRNARADVGGLSGAVLNAGVFFHDNVLLVFGVIAAFVIMAAVFAATAQGRQTLTAIAHATPGLRRLLVTRQRAAWSRIMALALAAGVDILEATSLASQSLPHGKIKTDAAAAIPLLRAGRPVDEAFLKSNTLAPVDASLVRAGQRSGALGEMFRAVADRNDEDMRDALKRFTLILEPAAIALVAGFVGLIVLGLVSALASVYDAVG